MSKRIVEGPFVVIELDNVSDKPFDTECPTIEMVRRNALGTRIEWTPDGLGLHVWHKAKDTFPYRVEFNVDGGSGRIRGGDSLEYNDDVADSASALEEWLREAPSFPESFFYDFADKLAPGWQDEELLRALGPLPEGYDLMYFRTGPSGLVMREVTAPHNAGGQ